MPNHKCGLAQKLEMTRLFVDIIAGIQMLLIAEIQRSNH
jgi:hypothetical protein